MTNADTVSSLGETATLERIFPLLPNSSHALVGPGDDCAVMAAPDGRFVVTVDMMVHGPDFRLAWSSAHDLGWKAAASNLADVAAMGAVPTALVVAIAAPPDTAVTFLEDFARGLRDGCAVMAPGCGVVGGDLSASPVLTISVTAFGDLAGSAPVLRSGARVGDQVAVSGLLGAAAAGLRVLFTEAVEASGAPDAILAEPLRERTRAQLAPVPPIGDGPLAAQAGATAMLDVSDGLALDAERLCRASTVAIDFESAGLGDDPALALGGGEDHALLATFPVEVSLPGGFRRIGTVREGCGILLDGAPTSSSGWDPYRGWDGGEG